MNEHCDMAALAGVEMAADALHGMAPDEFWMRMEESEEAAPLKERQARCVLSLVMCVTWGVVRLGDMRDRLAVVCSFLAPDLLPKDKLWHGHKEWAAVRAALAQCPPVEWEDAAGRLLIERVLIAGGWSEREVGKRAMLLLYAFQPNKALRPMMAQSFATMGEALGLRAKNNRSAVSAAMKSIVSDMQHQMERLTKAKGTGEFWFNKNAGCRERLSKAMMGKRNRATGTRGNGERAKARRTNKDGRGN